MKDYLIVIGAVLLIAVSVFGGYMWGSSSAETSASNIYVNPLQYEAMLRKIVREETHRQDITNKQETVKNYYSQETNNFLALPDSMKLGETYNNSLELLGE